MSSALASARDLAARLHAQIDAGAIEAVVTRARAEAAGAAGEAKAVFLHVLSVALTANGRLVESLRTAGASLDEARRAGSRSGELDAQLAIAAVLRAAGDHAIAIQTLENAEAIARELDDPMRTGLVLRQIGICCSILGRHQQGLSSLSEAVSLHGGPGTARDRLNTLLSLYNAHSRHAASLPPRSPERDRVLDEQLADWSRLARDAAEAGMTRLALMALGNHAINLHDLARPRQALEALADLLPRYRRHGMTPNETICHFEMGRAHQSLGEFDRARFHFGEAVGGFDGSGASGELRDALEGLADAHEALGDHAAALKTLRRVRAVEAGLDERAGHRNAEQRELRIELARLGSHWHRLASIDPLTGLANRRALEQWFAEIQPRVARGESMMLLLHDLDHFKSINDGFGHHVGDDVLRQVAKLIEANCRPHDLAVRYGGEEFLLAMLAIDHDGAVDAAERLRGSIEAQDWSQFAPNLRVTVSVGLAGAAEADGLGALLTLADRRLYAAKHAGRNRVVHSG